jgi:hypothetical protein
MRAVHIEYLENDELCLYLRNLEMLIPGGIINPEISIQLVILRDRQVDVRERAPNGGTICSLAVGVLEECSEDT